MSNPKTIKEAFERNKKTIELRPSVGQSTALTKVRVRNGTTCEVKSGSKTLGAISGRERAALDSCLVVGYAQQATVEGIPIEHIVVHVESDFDARGQFGITEEPPGFKELRYTVSIESPASKTEIQKIIEKADAHSPVLDDFKRPIPVKREVNIKSNETTS